MMKVVVGVVYKEVEEVNLFMPMEETFFMMVMGVVEEVTSDRTGEQWRHKK